MIVQCAERCWDGKRCVLYYPGDKADVDPLSPLAKYFEGWPPGTEVYTKAKGKEGTRIVPGKLPEANTDAVSEEDDKPTRKGKKK